ncbi:V-type ATP synthase subunit E [Picrophilus oshimae]|uniref:A-type ATP synthase subunit E n=2 Tax=Picrophilus torridus (strain ATCC 700027 / DSM 9790 / JCM 10055 / NBRC 100828 / KAW 2/3) TaxID=1122961 RepID=AATE_PICTO|nr:V-type ATP synthase subunit E [Picrophilus oshimae]Q6L1S4.1 RecName: Full=V-type ATP synthase subunit E; AltName: Full=V-ATPase subunit E [Picrophilus oshimae DSM 9789]AAT43078.1 A1AO H+ ATPase subunit E [Picrophilus oshimae DSM 9789]
MSLADIIKDIDKSREEQISKINDEYSKRIEELKKSCDSRIQSIKEYYEKKKEADIKTLKKVQEDKIKIDSKSIKMEKRREIVKDALDISYYHLMNITKSKRYDSILNSMVSTAIKTLGEDCEIFASESDAKKINNAKADHKINGGIIAYSKDKKRMLDFRLNSIFENIKDDLASYFYENIEE